MVIKKPELLAPAGDLTRLRYALAYGADAVYAGQPAFSLRARENGFRNLDDLAEGISLCREQEKKFYLTSNVIARNAKLEPFQKALLAALELKPDALIVADPGIISFVKKESPETAIHLSVQANTTNYLTAQFWQSIGVSRIILSRELRLAEILEIQKRCPGLELEVFVHGAVCMAMSGRCMLSDWTAHRDANQGMCNNSCRMPYRLYANQNVQSDNYREHEGNFSLERSNEENAEPIMLDEDRWGTYFMSSRDLCALDALPDLIKGNIQSFKIEGRTRSIYYLSAIVSAYRKAIDSIAQNGNIPQISRDLIESTDSRGRMPGFFQGPLPQNYETTQEPSKAGVVAAQITGIDEYGFIHAHIKNQISADSKLIWMTPEERAPVEVEALKNAKGEDAKTLHPGTNGMIKLHSNVTHGTNSQKFAFLVTTEPKKTLWQNRLTNMEDSCQNKQSSIFRNFEKAFAEGKLDYLRQLFLPYILNNIADLYQFKKNNLKEFAEAVGTQQLLQLYLYYKKMPLDMRRYMENQSESIKEEICKTTKERQEAVADWIKAHAERHRDLTVKSQCIYLEKIADQVIPPIEKALADYEKSQNC